jgi:hypothetical protein
VRGLVLQAKGIDYYLKKRGWFNYEDVGKIDVDIGTETGIADGLDFIIVLKFVHGLHHNDIIDRKVNYSRKCPRRT